MLTRDLLNTAGGPSSYVHLSDPSLPCHTPRPHPIYSSVSAFNPPSFIQVRSTSAAGQRARRLIHIRMHWRISCCIKDMMLYAYKDYSALIDCVGKLLTVRRFPGAHTNLRSLLHTHTCIQKPLHTRTDRHMHRHIWTHK